MAKMRSPMSDEALATEFISQFRNSIRYNSQLGEWMVWNGINWERDFKSRAFQRCIAFLKMKADDLGTFITKQIIGDNKDDRKLRAEAADAAASLTVRLLSANNLKNIMYMARQHQEVTMDIASWDSNPWLFNTPTGTIDLKTGNIRKHNALDYITKKAACGVSFDEPEMWLKFLHRIMEGDSERITYIQKIFGYSLVGLVKENRMWFFYGTGANGKSVLLNTMHKIFGDYAKWVASSVFMRTFGTQHPTELADLNGARLIMCGEVGKNAKWDEERIKAITGGDPIRARFMRQDNFEFLPQFAVVLAGNHKPDLEHVDEAIQRRFSLMPFDVTIPDFERDKELGEKLETEWPMILGWAIKGCQLWQQDGLKAPTIVKDVTDSYLTSGDTLLSWFEECCIASEEFTSTADLFKSYDEWTRAYGEGAMSMRRFSMQLEDRARALKITKLRKPKARGFTGVRILAADLD